MRKKKCTMSIPTIIERFQSGMTSHEIALEANVTARYINSVLQKHNVERQPHSTLEFLSLAEKQFVYLLSGFITIKIFI